MADTRELTTLLTTWLEAIDPADADRQLEESASRADASRQGGSAVIASEEVGDLDLSRAALHEAGHTVVGLNYGLAVERAWIQGDGPGEVRFGALHGWSLADEMSLTIATLAGPCVELLTGATTSRRWVLRRSTDLLFARQGIAKLAARAPNLALTSETFARLSMVAVVEHWPVIRRLANALKALRDLNAAEVNALCGQ